MKYLKAPKSPKLENNNNLHQNGMVPRTPTEGMVGNRVMVSNNNKVIVQAKFHQVPRSWDINQPTGDL